MTTKVENYGKYNCSDTLLEIELEMETHVEALQQTRVTTTLSRYLKIVIDCQNRSAIWSR